MVATLIILAAAIVAFLSNRVPLGVVAVGVALSLWATGVLTLEQALAGFGDPVVLFIASLFVVSEALEATGVTSWAGTRWRAWPPPSPGSGRSSEPTCSSPRRTAC